MDFKAKVQSMMLSLSQSAFGSLEGHNDRALVCKQLDYCRAINMCTRSSCEIRWSTSSFVSVSITTTCTVPVNALFSRRHVGRYW